MSIGRCKDWMPRRGRTQFHEAAVERGHHPSKTAVISISIMKSNRARRCGMIVALVGGGRSEIADARYGRLCPRSGLPFRPNGTTGALQRGRLIVPPQNCKAARSTVLVGHRPRHFCGTNAYFLVWIVVDPPNSGYAAASINSIPAEHWPVGLTAPTLCLPAEPIFRFQNDAACCSTKSAEASRACRLVPRIRRARRHSVGK